MFDPTKPVQTRDGRKARIVCTDRKHNDGFTIVALIHRYPELGESTALYTSQGAFSGGGKNHLLDLINIPDKVYYRVGMFTVREKPTFDLIQAPSKEALERLCCAYENMPDFIKWTTDILSENNQNSSKGSGT